MRTGGERKKKRRRNDCNFAKQLGDTKEERWVSKVLLGHVVSKVKKIKTLTKWIRARSTRTPLRAQSVMSWRGLPGEHWTDKF